MKLTNIGWCILLASFMLLLWVFVQIVKETSSTQQEPVKYQTTCLKGKTLLRITRGSSLDSPAGYVFDLDAAGKPIPCN